MPISAEFAGRLHEVPEERGLIRSASAGSRKAQVAAQTGFSPAVQRSSMATMTTSAAEASGRRRRPRANADGHPLHLTTPQQGERKPTTTQRTSTQPFSTSICSPDKGEVEHPKAASSSQLPPQPHVGTGNTHPPSSHRPPSQETEGETRRSRCRIPGPSRVVQPPLKKTQT